MLTATFNACTTAGGVLDETKRPSQTEDPTVHAGFLVVIFARLRPNAEIHVKCRLLCNARIPYDVTHKAVQPVARMVVKRFHCRFITLRNSQDQGFELQF